MANFWYFANFTLFKAHLSFALNPGSHCNIIRRIEHFSLSDWKTAGFFQLVKTMSN